MSEGESCDMPDAPSFGEAQEPAEAPAANVVSLVPDFDVLAVEPAPPEARQRDAAKIRRLTSELAAQALVIREQAAELAHSRKIFERASAAARIGVWECDLPDETLRWTDQVYDIFDLPRGSAVDRRTTLACYTDESREEMQALRSRAIEERGGFQHDSQIVTAKGNTRWIRLTASVECENGVPIRIFGMKQDITEEKILADRTRYLAEFDVMTGLANRSLFQARLSQGLKAGGALLLIDLDGFKQINDNLGHAFGDECLKDCARRLSEVCGQAGLVARIGGDEFAVLVEAGLDAGAIETLAGRIVSALDRPVGPANRSLRLGASVGIAHSVSVSSAELFIRADTALYAAKAAGRNTFRTFEEEFVPQGPVKPGERRRRRR